MLPLEIGAPDATIVVSGTSVFGLYVACVLAKALSQLWAMSPSDLTNAMKQTAAPDVVGQAANTTCVSVSASFAIPSGLRL
jgi:hypothetical protein